MALVPVTMEQALLAQAAREPYRGLIPEFEAPIIPWDDYKHFLQVTEQCWTMPGPEAHYWQVVRVMTAHLQWTGCRISELDKMVNTTLFGNVIYWEPGKSQGGLRKEYLPDEYLKELAEYRRLNRVSENQLFGVSAVTYKRYFEKYVRPHLGPRWNKKHPAVRNSKIVLDYRIQIKGFRKNFQTILFKYFYDKYADAGVALEMVSKRMKHSSEHMTAYHYVVVIFKVSPWYHRKASGLPRRRLRTPGQDPGNFPVPSARLPAV